MNRRIGRFEISNQLLFNDKNLDDLEIANIFKLLDFIPMRVKSLLYKDVTEYIGISSFFEEVPIALHPPFYEIVLAKEKKGKKWITTIKEVNKVENA